MFSIDFSDHFNIECKKWSKRIIKINKEIKINVSNNSIIINKWLKHLDSYQKELLNIIKIAKTFQKYELLVIIGMGGSFLGTKSIYEILKIYKEKYLKTKLLFIGETLTSLELNKILKYLNNKNFCVNIISKSGNTLETLIIFRLINKLLKKKFGEKYTNRIIITTDLKENNLKKYGKENKIKILTVPSFIGGRYSIFTSISIFPLAVAGFNVQNLLKGAKNIKKIFCKFSVDNMLNKYSILRQIAFEKGYFVEMFTVYNKNMYYFTEWIKQLFGESEGKEKKGIYPVSILNTRDLHSLGQFIQEGTQKHFETIIWIEEKYNCIVPYERNNFDNLNYLKNINIDDINKKIMLGVKKAHSKKNIPNMLIKIKKINEEAIGEIYCFFIISCILNCCLMEINPFNQPGVEIYKKEIKKLLEKIQ